MRRGNTKGRKNRKDSVNAPLNVTEIPMIYDARSQLSQGSIAYQLVMRLGFDPTLIFVLIVIAFPALFWCAGLADARSKEDFYIFSHNGTNYWALRILDSNVIAAPFNESSTTYDKEFLVKPVTELPGMRFKRVNNLRSS